MGEQPRPTAHDLQQVGRRLLDRLIKTLQQLSGLARAVRQQALDQPDVHRQGDQLLLRAVMDVALEKLALGVFRGDDLASGLPQQISSGRDGDQLVMQVGRQPQVAQHQTCLRRKAVQQLLLYRRQPLTLTFLDDEYAQQLASVPDGPDVPARHRIVG